jgi:hypothetical protein
MALGTSRVAPPPHVHRGHIGFLPAQPKLAASGTSHHAMAAELAHLWSRIGNLFPTNNAAFRNAALIENG